jgi:hypothetical protein
LQGEEEPAVSAQQSLLFDLTVRVSKLVGSPRDIPSP